MVVAEALLIQWRVDLLTTFAERLLARDMALASWMVAWVGAWTLVIQRSYLSRSSRRPFVRRWSLGWVGFTLAQAAAIGMETFPGVWAFLAAQQTMLGMSAVFVARGCLPMAVEKRWGTRLRWLAVPIAMWSAYVAFAMRDVWWARAVVCAGLAGTCVWTAVLYAGSVRHSHAARVLMLGFCLWAVHALASPFLTLSPLVMVTGQIVTGIMTLAVAVGITVLVREEAELSEQKYRGVLQTVSDAIFAVDLWSLEILDVNEAACRLTKHTTETLVGQNIMQLCPDLDKKEDNLLKRREMFSAVFRPFNEFHIIPSDGNPVICEGDTNLMHWHGRPVLQLKVREVEGREKVGRMVRRAEKLSSLGRLVAGVAHELNNPLAVVVGSAQLMAKTATPDEKLNTNVQRILHEGERAAKIVRDLLSFARPVEPQYCAVDVNQLIHNVVEVRESDLRGHQIELALQLAPKLSWTKADPIQVEQVLNNLTVNATQAMLQCPPNRRRLTIITEESGFFIKISIADTGPGVPPAIHERIFEPFFTTKPPGKGTGLGLSICHTIMEEHHGRIRLDPTVEGGALFIVELPVVACEPPEASSPSAAGGASVTGATQSTQRLLVVDDEPGIREVLQEVLSSLGYAVDTASNGKEAVRQIQSKRFDLILSDLCMPEMDGPALHRQITSMDAQLAKRMIFVTGDTVSPTSREFLESSGARWLTKPFNIRNIEDTVRNALHELAGGKN